MKLYIPELGDQIILTSDWSFDLFDEDRNETLMTLIGDTRQVQSRWRDSSVFTPITCTIPAGEILKIDRVYIRKGNKDYSSVTFLWKGKSIPGYEEELIATSYSGPRIPGVSSPYMKKYPKRTVRFWAKLDDVNNIEFEKLNNV